MFYGMDTAQGESFAQLMAQRREDLTGRADELNGMVRSLGSSWVGPDSGAFQERWDTLRSGPSEDVLGRLMDLARTLSADAQEQDVASAANEWAAFGERLGDIFTPGEWSWRNLLPNPQ